MLSPTLFVTHIVMLPRHQRCVWLPFSSGLCVLFALSLRWVVLCEFVWFPLIQGDRYCRHFLFYRPAFVLVPLRFLRHSSSLVTSSVYFLSLVFSWSTLSFPRGVTHFPLVYYSSFGISYICHTFWVFSVGFTVNSVGSAGVIAFLVGINCAICISIR